MTDEIARTAPDRHPALFMVLFLPFGVSGGFVGVTLGYLLAHAGVSTRAIGGLLALGIASQAWKVLWSPIVDLWLSYRLWYLLAVLTVAGGIAATGVLKMNAQVMPLLTVLVLIFSVAVGLAGMAADGLIARSTSLAVKGRAGGWSQMGNIGGAGVGGGAGLWIATHGAPWMAGLALGAVCTLCTTVLLFIPEPDHGHRHESLAKTLRLVGAEVWALARSRLGALALLLFVLPLSTGAAGGLFSAVSRDWHASAGLVALITGVGGGLAAGTGSFFSSYIGDRMDRQSLYALGGIVLAACAVGMALAARTPMMFAVFTLTYSLINGMLYGAYAAVVYEAAGSGAAATKCNILSSLSNAPIAAMTAIDGWAQSRWGSGGMLITEAVVGVLAIGVYFAVRLGTARRGVSLPAV